MESKDVIWPATLIQFAEKEFSTLFVKDTELRKRNCNAK